jgi:hypothetical protein
MVNQNSRIYHCKHPTLALIRDGHVEHTATARAAHQWIGGVQHVEDGCRQAGTADTALTMTNRGEGCTAMAALKVVVEVECASRKLAPDLLALHLERFQIVPQAIDLCLQLRLVLGPGCGCLLNRLFHSALLLF